MINIATKENQMTRILTFFLPQFHNDPHNSQWWGDGFTEWVNVKKAPTFFNGHRQPRVPLNGYYDLETPEALDAQFKEAEDFGVDGFVFYHYWSLGTRLLKKPIDMLLDNPEIAHGREFSLCWANHSWTRSWKNRQGAKDVLLEQEYEQTSEAMDAHIDFLMRCFADKRYTRHNGEPVFFIYRAEAIPNLQQYIERLRERTLKTLGVSCHISGTVTAWQSNWDYLQHLDAVTLAQPALSLYAPEDIFATKQKDTKVIFKPRHFVRTLPDWVKQLLYPIQDKFFDRCKRFDYDESWQKLLQQIKIAQQTEHTIHASTFVDFDNTARYLKRARLFDGFSPAKFENYLTKAKSLIDNYEKSDFLLINAWNEWAEGMYLQADEEFGNTRLEAVKRVSSSREPTE